ncbi:MAG: redoxin domain-containing protein [Thermoleophilaceae bacterium]|nr:redoxin domain-containing protein [Thermoleophilaceae bacterium]
MLLLLLFGFIAGAATAVSPCALPVLPVVFAAGATGGRKRPAGIATGLALSFTFATVLLVYLISALGLSDSIIRYFAIGVLLIFGLSLVIPSVSMRLEGIISRVTARSAGRISSATQGDGTKDGFWSGVLIGSGLGLVYAPCAGPILAGVITVSASQSFSAGRMGVALAYGLGSALTFYALMLGGRRLITPLAKRSQTFQYAIGAVMIVVAVGMFANLDTKFQTAIASDLPAFLVNPTESLERSKTAQAKLTALRGDRAAAYTSSDTKQGEKLPDIAVAPDFVGTQRWFNTPGNRPLTKASLRGKVYLVDFWTYTCINCIRTFPYLKAWQKKYEDKGFEIVGVHTPEFAFEKSASNVQGAINQNGLDYAVAQDNDFKTWDAFRNQYWPAHYLIDAKGMIRDIHYGEGKYLETEEAIRSLLRENGVRGLGTDATRSVKAEHATSFKISPETYLGAARADRYEGEMPSADTSNYGSKTIKLVPSTFRLGGVWKVGEQGATAGSGAFLDFRTVSRRTFLVLGSKGNRPRRMQVLLDGRPISAADAGSDVKNGVATISNQRPYRLVDTGKIETHMLTLRPAPGISGYAFTFG